MSLIKRLFSKPDTLAASSKLDADLRSILSVEPEITLLTEPQELLVRHQAGILPMKYKLIDAMAHNWSHSFMSGSSYVFNDFVFNDMYQLARDRPGEKVTITWIPTPSDELPGLTTRIQESLKHYREALPKHLLRHQIEVGAISQMRTEVYLAENLQVHIRSYVLDDRGKEHVQLVWP